LVTRTHNSAFAMPTPDELFERHPVDHLQRVQHNLTRDIDSKRQELRTMVGERYRDLMEAADTIARMAENTKDMMEAVEAARRKGAEMGAATNNAGILASQVGCLSFMTLMF
jgi:FMN phosphatase YigB (HAD superfamily)